MRYLSWRLTCPWVGTDRTADGLWGSLAGDPREDREAGSWSAGPGRASISDVGERRLQDFNLSEGPSLSGLDRDGLRLGLALKGYGRGEKVAWEIPIEVDGVLCSIALQKFGLRVYVFQASVDNEDVAEQLAITLLKRLKKASGLLERDLLEPLALLQARDGSVTVPNSFSMLRGMYQHFRGAAEAAIASDVPKPDPAALPGELAEVLTEAFQRKRLSLFNMIASVNAYFSALEHTLVLLFPFFGFDPASDDLSKFMGDRWRDKFKRIFSLEDPETKRHYDNLSRIADTYRNPFGHGLFDSHGNAVYFHTPIGPLPARLSKAEPQIRYLFDFTEDVEPGDVWAKLDGADEWLRSSERSLPMKYIESGFDISFDEQSRAEYRDALLKPDEFDEYIEAKAYAVDRAMNMDW